MRSIMVVSAVCLLAVIGNAAIGDKEANDSLRHPERVTVPEDIPFTALIEPVSKETGRQQGQRARVFPAIDFQHGHYEGWQNALFAVKTEGVASAKAPNPLRLMYQTCSPEFIKGIEAGYHACLKVCDIRLKSGESEEDLRQRCSEAYAPVSEAPAPAPSVTPSAVPSATGERVNPIRY